MPSHRISSSLNGFFIRSLEFFTDLIFFLICLALLVSSFISNLYHLAIFSGVIVAFTIAYIIKIHREENIYIIKFFSQPVLFFLITPPVFLRIEVVSIAILFGFFLVLPKKTFRHLDFPFGFFLSIFSAAIFIILEKLNILDIFSISENINLYITESSPGISGLYFLPVVLPNDPNYALFSILENYGIYALAFFALFALIRKQFFWDFLFMLLMVFSFTIYYIEDLNFFAVRIATYSAIWYFLYICMGRNFRALYLQTFFSAVVSLGLAICIDPYKYPPVLLIAVFFLFRSFLAFFREKRIFQDKGILKTGFK